MFAYFVQPYFEKQISRYKLFLTCEKLYILYSHFYTWVFYGCCCCRRCTVVSWLHRINCPTVLDNLNISLAKSTYKVKNPGAHMLDKLQFLFSEHIIVSTVVWHHDYIIQIIFLYVCGVSSWVSFMHSVTKTPPPPRAPRYLCRSSWTTQIQVHEVRLHDPYCFIQPSFLYSVRQLGSGRTVNPYCGHPSLSNSHQ